MNRLVAAVISLYLTAFLYLEVPIIQKWALTEGDVSKVFAIRAGIFIVLFVVLQLVIGKFMAANYDNGLWHILKIILFAVVFLGLLSALLYHVVPILPPNFFPPFLEPLVASETAFTAWLLAPLVLLFF